MSILEIILMVSMAVAVLTYGIILFVKRRKKKNNNETEEE